MSIYTIPLAAVPAQTLSCQLGANNLRLKIQWMTRFDKFRVDISYVNGELITAGRVMNVGVNMLDGLFPRASMGALVLLGDEPTPANLGIDNELVWTDG